MKISIELKSPFDALYRTLKAVEGRKLTTALKKEVEDFLREQAIRSESEVKMLLRAVSNVAEPYAQTQSAPTANSRPAPDTEILVVEPNGAEQKSAKTLDAVLDQLQ